LLSASLYDPKGRFRRLRLAAGATGRLRDLVPELVAPIDPGERTWHTLAPYAPSRHQDRRLPWAEQVEAALREEAHLRELPAFETVRVLQGPWLEFARWRAGQRRGDARRAVGVEVVFAEPVPGPLSLGALSHFGLGLFVPGASRAPTLAAA